MKVSHKIINSFIFLFLFISFPLAAASYQQDNDYEKTVLSYKPIGFWKPNIELKTRLSDISGNNNTLSETMSLRYPISNNIDNFTIITWVKWRGNKIPKTSGIFYIGEDDKNGYGIINEDHLVSIQLGGNIILSSNASLGVADGDNPWHFIAVVREKKEWKLYFDGKLANLNPAVGIFQEPFIPLSKTMLGYHEFLGLIKGTGFFDKALPAKDIETIYQSGL